MLVSQAGTKLESFGKMVIAPDGTITAELITEVPAEQTETLYTVQKGDSLSRIAKRELGDYSAGERFTKQTETEFPIRTGCIRA